MGEIILTGFWLIMGLIGFAAGTFVYWLPTIIAIWRKSPNIWLIAIVNFFGALVLPWLAALGMALWSDRRGDVTVINSTNLAQAPPAVPPSAVQASPYVPPYGALPAAPPARPSTAAVGEPGDLRHRQYPLHPGAGFAPPAPYDDAPPASDDSQWPSPGQGW